MTDDPTQRFNDRAGEYSLHRPDYPAAALDLVFAGLPDSRGLVVADIGAGTGLSSRALAERGARVLAIEPNAAMRSAAVAHPRVEWSSGRGEATGLPSASVDLVVCAQSFHWLAGATAVREFHRVLRPGGRLALVWNKKDVTDPFTRAFRESMFDLVGDAPAETFVFDPAVLAHGPFTGLRHSEVPHAQRLDLDGVVGRARSGSYVPRSGPVLDEILVRLEHVHERYADDAGRVWFRLITSVRIADRA